MEGQVNLTEGKIMTTLVRFAIPFLISSFLQALYGATDILIVGQFSHSSGVAAVAIGSQVMQTITGIILGITTGGTILIAQYIGAKKEKEAARTIGAMICVFSVMAVILGILMVLFAVPITKVMDTPTEAFNYTKQYIIVCSCGIPFIVGYNAVSGILRGLGDSKTPVIFIAIACTVNAVTNLITVGILNMGATGSAASTIFAQGISFILALIYIYKKGFSFEFNRSYIRLDKFKIRNIFKLGLPIALQDGLINMSFLLITAIINTMGLIASASVGVVEKVIGFTMLPPVAFAAATATITAQNIGAGKQARAQKSLYYAISISLVFGLFFCIYSQINPKLFISIFTKDEAVIRTASMYLKSYSLDCVLVCMIFNMNSFFSGCGHSTFPMAHSLLATFLLRVPGSYFFSKLPNATLYQIGFAAPLATAFSIVLCILYMKSGRWRENKIIVAKV